MMGKIKNTLLGSAILGLTYIGYNFLSTSNNCIRCNSRICSEDARMIFIEKNAFCSDKMMNLKFNIEGQRLMNKMNTCGDFNESSWQLEGFYIQPKYEVWSNNQNNELQFMPHWVSYLDNQIQEVIGSAIIIPATLSSISTTELPNLNIPIPDVSVLATPLTNNTFNHNILQFNGEAIQDSFGKAYIPYLSLKLILEHCQYLGISGSYVSSGNIGVVEWNNRNGGLVKKSCNQNYFTYRFVGFNDASRYFQNIPFNTKVLIKSNLKAQGSTANDNRYETIPTIPTETWAVPCPPMWKPI